MIVVLQRVERAAVRVDGAEIAAIGRGVCLLACVVHDDTEDEVRWLAAKVAALRVFEDERGATNLALADVGGAALVVPQFTLAADWRKGRRPSFTDAARPEAARPLLAAFVAALAEHAVPVSVGSFGAAMAVELINNGPFTLILDSRRRDVEARS